MSSSNIHQVLFGGSSAARLETRSDMRSDIVARSEVDPAVSELGTELDANSISRTFSIVWRIARATNASDEVSAIHCRGCR